MQGREPSSLTWKSKRTYNRQVWLPNKKFVNLLVNEVATQLCRAEVCNSGVRRVSDVSDSARYLYSGEILRRRAGAQLNGGISKALRALIDTLDIRQLKGYHGTRHAFGS